MKNFKVFVVWLVLAFSIGFICGCADYENVDVRITDTSGKIFIITDADIYVDEERIGPVWKADILRIKSKKDYETSSFNIKKRNIQEITIVLKGENNGK